MLRSIRDSLLEFWMMPYIPPAAPAIVMTVPSTICSASNKLVENKSSYPQRRDKLLTDVPQSCDLWRLTSVFTHLQQESKFTRRLISCLCIHPSCHQIRKECILQHYSTTALILEVSTQCDFKLFLDNLRCTAGKAYVKQAGPKNPTAGWRLLCPKIHSCKVIGSGLGLPYRRPL